MPGQSSVLITGASTGIGQACALHLDRLGWRVFAGVRQVEDAAALRDIASPNLEPLILDVTQADQVAAAAEQISALMGERGLDGLVNNAGISIGGPLEFIPMPLVRLQFEVNVLGQVSMIQAFLSLLRQAHGRIINISSTSGLHALPILGPYSASKFALEALSDSLRVELRPWDIKVILVEPGSIATPIWARSLATADAWLAEAPPDMDRLYGKYVTILRDYMISVARRGMPVERISETVVRALTVPHPRARYLIISYSHLYFHLMRLAPVGLRDRIIARRLGIE
jgi:NAD(P)-dependent dehydrogenase (short-subunit alcohol dehydrogenase family)